MTPGTRLGPYEIVALLGAGGMGEVYRAVDTNLNREVAIKVLLPVVANDAERLARFSREAQVLASLNHPNIAQIHGLEDAAGVRALVMELVEGPTLADRIANGAISTDEALPIARQIAEAVEAAHERGIIHRDLKPANIKVRADGAVKVLDFGLAKALDPIDASSTSAANSPTLSMQATAAGVILGTAAYMAPEQARGRVLDRRADIWAFGCVLYEMVTGARAFRGDDVTDTIVAVLSREPDWRELPATASGVRPLLASCLKKDPRQRLQAIGDARIQIDELISGTSDHVASRTPAISFQHVTAAAVAALTAGALVATLVTWALMRPAAQTPAQPTRFAISLPAAHPLAFSFNARDLALSPEGRHLVYTAGAERQLMLRGINELHARPLAGVTNARAPFFSPDGGWIGFFDQRGNLRKVSITGGSPTSVCQVTGTSRGASWGQDGMIVFATSERPSGLRRVTADGGEPTVLTTVDLANGEQNHYFPSVLPDGRGVLFTIVTGDSNASVAVLDLKTGQRKVLLRNASQAEYVETGHLVYVVANTLWAVRFGLAKLELLGEPVPVLDRLMTVIGSNRGGNFSVSRHGTLAYVPLRGGIDRSLVWVNRNGTEQPIASSPGLYHQPRLSPDGKRVAVAMVHQDNSYDIFTLDLARQTRTRLTFGPAANSYAVWTPDGRDIIYASSREGVQNLFRRAADGTGAEERLTTISNNQRPTTISPDGSRLVFEENSPKTAWDLGLLSLGGTPHTTPFIQLQFDERNAEISPDGNWLAYDSNASGQEQVYVRRFPKGDGLYQVSTEGGRTPAWAPNSRTLFFANGSSLMSVAVQPTVTFRHDNPTKLFEQRALVLDARVTGSGSTSPGGAYRMYDVSPDGARFLMVKEVVEDPNGTQAGMVVVLNWFEELKDKLPGAR